MGKKWFKKKVIAVVTIFAILSSTVTPVLANIHVPDKVTLKQEQVNPISEETIINFDEGQTGGFKKLFGNGEVTFVDNAMKLQANGETVIGTSELPQYENGFVEFDITNQSQGRIGFLFRQTDNNNYQGIGYDVDGKWIWINNQQTQTIVENSTQLRDKQRVRIEYVGSEVTLYINNQLVFTKVNEDFQERSGSIGFRVWGYNSGQTQGTCVIDNLKLGHMELPTYDENGNFVVNFDNKRNRGGFEMVNEHGTLEFHDGEDDLGYMVFAKKGNNNTNKANAVAKLSPHIKDGFVEADITNNSQGRFALLFRYQNQSSFVGVGYDTGNWTVFNAQHEQNQIQSNVTLKGGKKTRIRAEFVGNNVSVYLDGQLAFTVENERILGANNAGKTGLRTWGYADGATQGNIKVDNLKVGSINSVMLDPESAFVQYEDAGKYDINISLSQTENSLVRINNGETVLQRDIDYIVAGQTVTLKKEYIEKVKNQGTTKLIFTFDDGFKAIFELQVQSKPSEEYSYKRDFKNGIEGFTVKSGIATVQHNQDKNTVSVENGQNVIIIDDKVKELYNSDIEFTFDPNNDSSNFAIVARYTSPEDWTAIGIDGPAGNKSSWKVWNSKGQVRDLIGDGDRVYAKRVVPYKVRVRILENTLTIWFDNGEVFSGEVDILTKNPGKAGVRYWGGTGANIYNLEVNSVNLPQLETTNTTEKVLSTSKMQVKVDSLFPRVIDYTLSDGNQKAMGQERPYYVVEIDNKQYRPTVRADFTDDTATYHMSVEKEEGKTVTFDVIISVKENVLSFNIDNINDKASPIHSFNFPTHSLVSLDNTNGSKLIQNKYDAGSTLDLTTQKASNTYSTASLVVMNNNEIAIGFNTGSINNLRGIAYQTMRNGEKTTTGIWANGYQYRGIDGEIIEKPWSKVALGTDLNKDGKVDFQDGAILRRDYCDKDGESADMQYSQTVMRSLNTIAMNVGSGAQYPFLRILDNIKKVSLGIDNFPQNIIIKGYNGQGHDSNNGDFANFNEAAGGIEDFNVLLDKAQDYNTTIGVHINHSETYPESITYKDYASTVGAWAWYDNSKHIIRENDILAKENGMGERLEALDKATKDKLSLIYVDVYFGNRWPMHKIINKINELGMAVATEYPNEMDTHSVLAHHIGGHMNNAGNLARFVNHQTQDIFGNSPLFRGATDRNFIGINGWQGSYKYKDTLNKFYTQILPNKFLAQYPIMRYETENEAVLGKNLNVVTKIENGKNIITLDGHKVADGNKIFIPWTEDGENKIYHFNPKNESTTWTLPKTFENLQTVKVFELSDKGRTNEQTLTVVNNQITINAKSNTPYVIFAGEEKVNETDLTKIKWGEGGLVKDAGFDSYTKNYAWITQGNIEFASNEHGNTEIKINGTDGGSLTQKITGLEPGESYSASVWARVSDGRKATIKVTLPNGEEVSNFMDIGNINYGMHHTSKYNSKYQRLKVNFIAPLEGEVTLSLIGDESQKQDTFVNFDDVRVVKNKVSDKKGHTYFEDFENTDEGYGVFLVTEADNSHLSETNKGVTDDTISGRFSLKTRQYGNYFRTAPYTVRLKPNTTYTIGLDFLANRQGAFTLAVKSDKAMINRNKDAILGSVDCGANSWSEGGSQSLTVTTGNYDDYYIDITMKNSGDYVIDNFYVDEHIIIDKNALESLYNESSRITSDGYTPESFAKLTKALEIAKTVLDNLEATKEDVTNAYNQLKQAVDTLEPYATEQDIQYLQSTIDKMKDLSLEFFDDDENWKNLQDKIKEAERLVQKSDVTKNQVKLMVDELYKLKDKLVSLVNKEKLKDLYKIVSKVDIAEVVDGVDATKFTSAIAKAKEVLENDRATQDMVNQAYRELDDAYSKIIPKENAKIRDTLKQIVKQAQSINRKDYTQEQLIQIDKLIADANSVVTWKDFDLVIDGLNAILHSNPPANPQPDIPVEPETKPEQPNQDMDDEKPSDESNEFEQNGNLQKPSDIQQNRPNKENSNIVQTSDNLNMLIPFALLIFAVLSFISIIINKKKIK